MRGSESYLVLEIKAIDRASRTFSGMATTPAVDLGGDSVDPFGVKANNPIPLLLYHDRTRPIGWAALGEATAAGVPFTATIADIPEPGTLRDRCNEAWQSIKTGLASAVSIGWRPLAGGVAYLGNGVRRLSAIHVHELSIESLPMNPEAVIDTIKTLAAAGRQPAGVSAEPGRGRMTITESITQFANKRAALVAQMDALTAKNPGETLAGDDATNFDAYALEVKSIDDHIARLKTQETLAAATAAPVVPIRAVVPAGRVPIVTVTPNEIKGQAYVRAQMAKLAGKGSHSDAIRYAEQRWPDMPEVALSLKAAVAPATTTDPAWAGVLVRASQSARDFIALARAASVIGKLNLRNAPPDVPVPIQTGGGTYVWVGQGKAKPVSKLAFGSAVVERTKIAGILVMSEELARSSDPAAEDVFRSDMIAGIAAFKDAQFLDPAVAFVAGQNPASVTNGVTGAAATTDPAADIAKMLAKFTAAKIALSSVAIVMSESNAFALAMAKTVGGEQIFPGLTIAGGSVGGVKVVTSETAGSNIIGIAQPLILYWEDGAVEIDVSREATIEMSDAPSSPQDPATTVMTSLWQNNLIGVRAEQFTNWKRTVLPAVQLITGATYAP